MKLAALSLDIAWKNPQENFARIADGFSDTAADLYVLPEMFSTGFCMEPAAVADAEGAALSWMKAFAQEKGAAVTGSVAVAEGGKYYNRMYFVQPDGATSHYDKRHLFSYSGEDEVYTAGTQRVVVQYGGVRFLLQVCYDLRFPVFARNRDDYDVAIYVANWPEKRIDAWNLLLKARAVENMCYAVGVNRTGTDGHQLFYPESSNIYFADGSAVSHKTGNVLTAELDLQALKKHREHFRFLQDRDDFALNI